MNRLAFVFASAPHGTAAGREGLDALLATSAMTNDGIGVFFISDGIYQLVDNQQPKKILARDYISTFKILPLYGIQTFWICASSLRERGLNDNIPMVLETKIVDAKIIRKKLSTYDRILNF